MDSYIIYVIDTETTGLDAVRNDVIEISACRLIDTGSAFSEEQMTWCLKALNPDSIEDEALKINGHKKEDILWLTEYGKQTYLEPSIAVAQIEKWINDDEYSSMDRIFAGQNPFFDIDGMKELWRKVGATDTFPFAIERNNRVIDTKMLAAFIDICNGKRRLRYDLSGLVKAFGVKKGKAHRAAADTKMTADLFAKITSGFRSIMPELLKNVYIKEDGT